MNLNLTAILRGTPRLTTLLLYLHQNKELQPSFKEFIVFYMVSETFEPTRKEKQKVQPSYKIKTVWIQSKIQAKGPKRLQKTKEDFTSLQTLLKDSIRLHRS